MKTKSIVLLVALLAVVLALGSCDLVKGLLPGQEQQHEHIWDSATCTAPKTCSKCGVTEGAALGHAVEEVAGKAATCTEAGLTSGHKCSVCNEILLEQEEIPALGHNLLISNAVAPTCTETGLTQGEACTRCDYKVEQEVVDALGHDMVIDEAATATCTESGLTAGEHCTRCDHKVAQELIPALGHDMVKDAAVAPTCTETGLTEGSHCSRCDRKVAQEVVDALGHDIVKDAAVAPTCTETGLTEGSHCSRCDHKVAQEAVDALGHDMVKDAAVAPTCTETGLTEGSHCSRCDYKVAQDVVDALGHKEETVTGKAATCTESGLTDGKKCSVCGVTIEEQKVINALGHKDENGDYVCDICEAQLCTDHVPADAVVENNAAPTCTEAGSYDSVIKCSVCSFEISRETVSVPATGHSFADCECSVCHAVLPTLSYGESFDFATAEGFAAALASGKIALVGDFRNNGDSHQFGASSSIQLVVPANTNVTITGHSTSYGIFDIYLNGTKAELGAGGVYKFTVTEETKVVILPNAEAGNSKAYIKGILLEEYVDRTIVSDTTINFGSEGNYKDSIVDFSGIQIGDNGDNNSQVKNGSFDLLLKAGSKVVIHGYPGYTSYQLNGGAEINDEYYTYIALEDTTLTVTPVNGNNYFYSIEITLHEGVELVEGADSTCSVAGYDAYYICSCHGELTAKVDRELASHSAGAAADCENAQICTVCGTELSPALGHNYDAPSFTWSDDNSTCTASRVCANDASHVISETATVSKVVLNVSASKVTYTYTVVFADYEAQFKSVEGGVELDNNIATVYAPAIADRVASHDYVKFAFHNAEETHDFVIYYSEVDVWDGASVSTALQGSGTEEDPYLIQSAADLAYVAQVTNTENEAGRHSFIGKYLKLTKSIDLNNFELHIGTGSGWGKGFQGYFDGNNCTIRNMNNQYPLFGGMYTSWVTNLSLYGKVTSTRNYIAALGSYTYNTTFHNITNYADITGTNGVGGVVAIMEQNGRTSEGLVNYGTIVATGWLNGGIVGKLGGNLNNSVNWGSVTANGDSNVGGIAGGSQDKDSWYGTISNSACYGIINNNGKTAGHIVGGNYAGMNVVDCYATHVYSSHVDAKDATCEEAGNVEYNHCAICNKNFGADGKEVADVVILAKGHAWDEGVTADGMITFTCQNDPSHTRVEIAKCTVTVNHIFLDGTVAAEAEALEFDYDTIATIYAKSIEGYVASHDYVKVHAQGNSSVTIYYSEVSVWDGTSVSDSLSGSGTAEDPFIIGSAADFAYFASVINAVEGAAGVNYKVTTFKGQYFKLTKSIDLNGANLMIGMHAGWNNYQGFFGTFDGNNCSIRGIGVDKSTEACSAALFGCVNGGMIKNLSIYGSVKGNSTVGGLVAYTTSGAKLDNITSYVTVTATVHNGRQGTVGGVVANQENSAGAISNCVNYGDVTCDSYIVGGIAGSGGAAVTNCANWGNVTGGNVSIGGIFGSTKDKGSISGCVNYGTITGTSNIYSKIGGIVGSCNKPISNCENYGTVIGKADLIGGIAGEQTKEITGCVNYGDIIGSCTSTNVDGITASGVTKTDCVNNGSVTTGNHSLTHFDAKDATCEAEGNVAYDHCSICNNNFDAEGNVIDDVVTPKAHVMVDGACSVCGIIPNIFADKTFVPSSDAAANKYSDAYGYQTITDGIIYEEGNGRYSSKSNGGKVEGIIDLGGVYNLSEFKVYLYWNDGINMFGSGLKIEVLFDGEWTTVVDCATVEALQAYWVDNPGSVDKEWLVFDLGGVAASQVKFTIPGQTSKAYSTFYEMECSAKRSSQVEHQHILAEAVKENEKAATCEADGSYDSVVYCSDCGAEISRETKTVAALGHAFSASIVWSEDNSTCTVKEVCANDPSHVVGDSVSVTSRVVLNVTASKVTYTYCAGEYTKTVEADLALENNIATINAPALAGRTASHEYVKFGFHDATATYDFTIYYSEVDVWDGTSVSESLQGSGTEEDPYLVQSGADLAYIAKVVNDAAAGTANFEGMYFKMTKSIDLNGKELKIGGYTANKSFHGFFDGNNCAIKGINATQSLFGMLKDGSIKNLSTYGSVTTTEKKGVAGLVSYMTNATVDNITNYANITGAQQVAGVVGWLENNTTTIANNCVNYGTINATSYQVGGIAGFAKGTLTNCTNFGDVTSTGSGYVGGIGGAAKDAKGSRSNCVNYGNVKGTDYVGGCFGQITKTTTNCYCYGTANTVTTGKNIGEVVGSGASYLEYTE